MEVTIRASKKLRTLREIAPTVAYRGYLIRWTMFTLDKPDARVWVERDGIHIGWADSVDAAKAIINYLASPDD